MEHTRIEWSSTVTKGGLAGLLISLRGSSDSRNCKHLEICDSLINISSRTSLKLKIPVGETEKNSAQIRLSATFVPCRSRRSKEDRRSRLPLDRSAQDDVRTVSCGCVLLSFRCESGTANIIDLRPKCFCCCCDHNGSNLDAIGREFECVAWDWWGMPNRERHFACCSNAIGFH